MLHLARVPLDIHSVVALLQPGTFTVVSSAIPPDARIMQVHYDSSRHRFWVVLTLPSTKVRGFQTTRRRVSRGPVQARRNLV
jgi:hypothetical protein